MSHILSRVRFDIGSGFTHAHTRVPYGCTVKSGVTMSYIRQVSQDSEPAGLKTSSDFILLEGIKQ